MLDLFWVIFIPFFEFAVNITPTESIELLPFIFKLIPTESISVITHSSSYDLYFSIVTQFALLFDLLPIPYY